MAIQQLIDKCEELDQLINSTEIEDTFPILDGVNQPFTFCATKD